MRESLFGFMKSHVGVSSGGYAYTTKFVEFQNASRTDLGFLADGILDWQYQILPHLREISHAKFTNLLDYFLSTAHFSLGSEHPIERFLSDGGSAWTVMRWNDTHARLTKRVPDGVQAAVSQVLSAKDAASLKLQEAWVDAYGTKPRASVAYSHAVVAVETAALSLIPVTPQSRLSPTCSRCSRQTHPSGGLCSATATRLPGPRRWPRCCGPSGGDMSPDTDARTTPTPASRKRGQR